MTQPSALVIEWKSIFVCAKSSVLMIKGTQGMCTFLKKNGDLYDAFEVHTTVACSIQEAQLKVGAVKPFSEQA